MNLDLEKLKEEVKKLKGLEKRYYNFIPDECWMSEENQAEALNVKRNKIQRVKKSLVKKGLLTLELQKNGKRKNPKHKLLKTIPIIVLLGGEYYSSRFLIEDDYAAFNYINDSYYSSICGPKDDIDSYNLNLSLLENYTADEINKMDKLSKVQLYMDCGYLVLPTHYPIFTEQGVKCSCQKGFDCAHKGKHPKVQYKYLNPYNYQFVQERFLNEFRKNPDLNIGFKVMGFSVLDIDNKYNGHKTLEQLKLQSDIDFKGVMTSKSGNGNHILASNKNLKNTAQSVGTGLDIRSEGGFIVAPGSRHQSGNYYEWEQIGELATIPDEWLKEPEVTPGSIDLKPNKTNQTTSEKLKDIKLPKTPTPDYVIKEGYRELTLFKWGCRERGKGSDKDEIYDILITIRDTYCEDGDEPVTDEEIRVLAECIAESYKPNIDKNKDMGLRK